MLQITRRPHAGIVYALAAALCLILTARPICASVPPDRVVVTHHRARISGHEIQYVAVAGTLLIRDARRRPTASIFYVAFIAEGLGPSARRPITFAYNGGPGISSASIDVGGLGPRIVVPSHAPGSRVTRVIIDNSNSILDVTDLVFFDPVSTGFSRAVGVAKPSGFFGVDQDADASERFIRRYLAVNGRQNSPKYLAGISYGTMRSAVLARKLEDAGIRVSGVTLMSTVLDFAAVAPSAGDDLPYWLYLPSEAAVAAFHRKAAVASWRLASWLSDVRAFAAGPYARALAQGDALGPDTRDRLAARLHAYTGLSAASITRSGLRIGADRFRDLLLAKRNSRIGRYDGRVIGAATGAPDPSGNAATLVTSAFPAYVRGELGYRTKEPYIAMSLDANLQWDWLHDRSGPLGTDVIGDLADAMLADPHLRVLSANGLYDLTTPFFATEYQLQHLGLPPSLRANVSFTYYRAGHQIFLDPGARATLKADLDRFYARRQHPMAARRAA